MKQGGYFGSYIMIDATHKTWRAEELSEELASDYLGGRGVGVKLLYDLQEGRVDPLSPDNHVIIFTGPLAGTNAPGTSRISFMSKSPVSNTINISSMGGVFPNAFKRTGFDGLVIGGKSQDKVWILITPEGVEFHPADDLWGLKTSETEAIIKEKVGGKCRVACIGPAGENLVRLSAVVSDTRTASRGGTGAVMGSKNIKAVAVSGDKEVSIYDKQALEEAIKEVRARQSEDPGLMSIQMNGTAGLISVVNAMGGLPTKNYQAGTFEFAEDISGAAITEKNRVKAKACASCPVACSLIAEAKSGKHAGKVTEGPEYESAVMLGSNLMVKDLDTIIVANLLCDEYGLDSISAGNVIGFAMECYEKKLLTEEDTGGMALNWGDGDVVLSLIEKIAKREGIGGRLAEGVARMSKEIPGSESFAMHVKGLELAAYDPRAVWGQGLSYATAPRGGDHGRGGYMIIEFFGGDVDLYTHEGKAPKAAELAEHAAVLDSACVCNFNFIPFELIPKLLTAVVGKEYTVSGLKECAQRMITLERKFNIREGFGRKDDTLPPRLLNEPLPDGMAEGKKVEGLDLMLDDLYRVRGWDKEGTPPE
jgi:aldehyde:ferredoxin oxidoreductase